MNKKVNIWLIGNTGLRNPNRIQEGFKVFSESRFVGNLRTNENEVAFMRYLNEKGIIVNNPNKDTSGSHARKWRLMFSRNGFIYPKYSNKDDKQNQLGKLDEITPFGKVFLNAESYSMVQECFLRSMSVEQIRIEGIKNAYFSPLRWILAIMIELEKRTGSSELRRIEFSLWGQTTDPSYNIDRVVDEIIDLRERREASNSKKVFDREETNKRAKNYNKKKSNFKDYCDLNLRYLRITGIVQRKGKGIVIVPSKHILAQKLASNGYYTGDILKKYKELCNGAKLPNDDVGVSKMMLESTIKEATEKGIIIKTKIDELNTVEKINSELHRIEDLILQSDEETYAKNQSDNWQEIADYMDLLIKGGGKKDYNDDYSIEVPKDETPAYFEWVMWRAALALDCLNNKPYEMRGFKLDADFMPISTASGGKGDLYQEFDDYAILTEVTMSTSSRQEAMEGEPVRRHVYDAIVKYSNKHVYGLFVAIKIDTNTAETFRHGVWYAKNDAKQRLDIVPLTLLQYRNYFVHMFKSGNASPDRVRDLLIECERQRDILDAPKWKKYIDETVQKEIL